MIRTYTSADVPSILEPVDGAKLAPGSFVRDRDFGGFGTVVSVTDSHVVVLWTIAPETTMFRMPPVRQVKPDMHASDLLKVQPMTPPVGLVFYLDYAYGSGSKS